MSTSSDQERELLALNQMLLEAAVGGDWSRYADLCSPTLSCFEAETNGHLVEGLAFHRFYFPEQRDPAADAAATSQTRAPQVTMARPHLRWLSENAVVISYTRIVQSVRDGSAVSSCSQETRIWQRINGSWLQVHVHRS